MISVSRPKNTYTGTNTWELEDPFGIPVEVQGGMHKVELKGVVDYCVVHLMIEDVVTGEVVIEKVRMNDATSGRTVNVLVGPMPEGVPHIAYVT